MTTPSPAALPGVWAIGRSRSVVELRSFARNRSSLVFTLAFPLMLLLVLGAIFQGEIEHTGVDYQQVFVAGIIASGIMSVAFSGLAITMAIERGDGTVKRLAATPMPMASYFIAKAVLVVVTALVETGLLVLVGTVLFGLSMPSTPEKWFTLLWTMVLGSVAFALMAIGYSSMIPNPRSAAAMVTPPFIVLQFISGVFFPYSELPRWMQAIAALFPLKWIVQGIHSVFLPDSFQSQEIAGSWEHPKTSLVLLAWCVIAAYACIRKFRWRDMS